MMATEAGLKRKFKLLKIRLFTTLLTFLPEPLCWVSGIIYRLCRHWTKLSFRASPQAFPVLDTGLGETRNPGKSWKIKSTARLYREKGDCQLKTRSLFTWGRSLSEDSPLRLDLLSTGSSHEFIEGSPLALKLSAADSRPNGASKSLVRVKRRFLLKERKTSGASNVKTQEGGHYGANKNGASRRHKFFDIALLLIYRCNQSFKEIIHLKHTSTQNQPAYTYKEQR